MVKITVVGSVLWGLVFGVLSGCSSTPQTPAPAAAKGELLKEPPSRTGNPDSYEVFGKRYYVDGTSEGYRKRGIASWYGPKFHGKRTSSGTPFDMYALTAAHKNLPIPTYARVTHQDNGRSVVVKINDRGPFVGDRIIDLSYAAAVKLDMIGAGTAPVEVVALPPFQYLADYQPHQANPRLADAGSQITPPVHAPEKAVARRVVDDVTAPSDKAGQGMQRLNHNAVSTGSKLAHGDGEPAVSSPDVELVKVAYTVPSSATARAPAPPPVVATNDRQSEGRSAVFLQVGAFAQSNNAEQFHARLAHLIQHPVSITKPNDALYRVRIGPLANTEEVEQLQGRLAALGIDAHLIIFDKL